MSEREAFASLALQLRRQGNERLRLAREAAAAGKPAEAAALTNRAAQYRDDAGWYLGKAKARPFHLQPEN